MMGFGKSWIFSSRMENLTRSPITERMVAQNRLKNAFISKLQSNFFRIHAVNAVNVANSVQVLRDRSRSIDNERSLLRLGPNRSVL
jgi:hypothetical protein